MKHFLTLFALLTTSLAFGQESCPNVYDYNDNNTIDIEDFLGILGLFADDDTDDDGIWDSQDDCIDLEACNYAASPTEPCAFIDVLGECGGGCAGDGDGDGICDDEDDCVGVVDECGVCNGPGPTEVVIEDIVLTYDSVFLPLDDDWYVFPISADTTFGYSCAPFFGNCGDPVSYQGYDYATVLIGEQCWFAENLRSEYYENGNAIPANLSGVDWVSTYLGAVSIYGEGTVVCSHESPDGDACDEVWSLNEYGRLYNWYAVDDARGLCPSGWHVPTGEEWTALTDYLGDYITAGEQMKAAYGWKDGGNGTNSSGFSGLPGGYRGGSNDNTLSDGRFYDAGHIGWWWSSTLNENDAVEYRYMTNVMPALFTATTNYFNTGVSVRCIQDSE